MTALLDKMMSLGAAAIERQIGEKSEMLPVCHVMYQDGHSIVVGMPMADRDEKQVMAGVMRAMFRKTGVIAYCLTMEAWTATEPVIPGERIEDHEFTPPSERADRQEVFIAFVSDGNEKRMRMWDIERDWKGAVGALKERDVQDSEFGGMFPNLL
jgi:hypothetical protein